MSNTVNMVCRIIQGLSTKWILTDKVVPQGVVIYETDTKNLRISDGVSLYKDLTPVKLKTPMDALALKILENINTDDSALVALADGTIPVSTVPGSYYAALCFVADIPERDSLIDRHALVYVIDARGDPTVTRGSAIYQWVNKTIYPATTEDKWIKISEQESMDINFTNYPKKTEINYDTLTSKDGTNLKMLPAERASLASLKSSSIFTDAESVVYITSLGPMDFMLPEPKELIFWVKGYGENPLGDSVFNIPVLPYPGYSSPRVSDLAYGLRNKTALRHDAISPAPIYVPNMRTSVNKDSYNLGTNDFTIEFWMKTETTVRGAILKLFNLTGSPTEYSNWMRTSWVNPQIFQFGFSLYNGAVRGSTPLINDTTMGTTWHHYAQTRKDGKGQLYFDGVATLATEVAQAQDYGIITRLDFGIQSRAGGIQDLRIYNGLCKYTGNFNPYALT